MGIDFGTHLGLPKINWFVYLNSNKLQNCPEESCLLHLRNSAKLFQRKTFPKTGSIQKES